MLEGRLDNEPVILNLKSFVPKCTMCEPKGGVMYTV